MSGVLPPAMTTDELRKALSKLAHLTPQALGGGPHYLVVSEVLAHDLALRRILKAVLKVVATEDEFVVTPHGNRVYTQRRRTVQELVMEKDGDLAVLATRAAEG